MTKDASLLRGIGLNIAAHRRSMGMRQSDLAERIGKSVQWVSAVEQGRRHAERLADLVHIAAVLGCRLDDLLGRPVEALAPGVRPRAESVAAVRAVMMRAAVPSSMAASGSGLEEIDERIVEAWRVWHGSPSAHTILGEVLPGLLADAIAAHAAASERRAGARTLAGAYQIARQWLHHIPDGDLAWIAAERAMNAAREADDPHLIALGAWALSASYRRAGQQDEATALCLAAAAELKPRLDGPPSSADLLADYGMLHLAASISAAQSDEDSRAWAFHRLADDAARALGGFYQPWTAFGSGNVDIHGLAIRAELGRADDVVDYASRLHIDAVPSVERRARVLIDTARGFVQRGEDEAAILVLLDAEQISIDEVRHSNLVQEMLRELIHRDRARARAHVRALATRVGLLAA